MTICDYCGGAYDKVRKSQRFCSANCRQAHHNSRKLLAGPQGVIAMIRKLKSGATSMTLRFFDDDAMRSMKFSVGDMVQVGADGSAKQTDLGSTKEETDL